MELTFKIKRKKAEIFQGLYPLNPHKGSSMNPLRSLEHLEIDRTYILNYLAIFFHETEH